MSNALKLSVLLVAIALQPAESLGQNQEKIWRSWSFNLNGGVSLFYGDVANYRYYKSFKDNSEWSYGVGGILQKQFGPLFTVRGQLYYGELSGTKRRKNFWFESNLIETSLSLKVDLANLILEDKFRKFSAYATAGIGLAQWRTDLKRFDTNEQIDGNGDQGSGFDGRTISAVIPFGGGVEYNINEQWSLNLEASLRPVDSDVLDAHKGGFDYDFYSYYFAGITYRFVKREQLPVLPAKDLAVEEKPVEIVTGEEEVPDKEIVVRPPQPDPERNLEDRLLDAESRTGLYESPWPGVEFTVQIAASKRISDPVYFEKRFDLPGEVTVNQGNGWYRFSVGRYIKYWRAREYRNILRTRNGIEDAFVVAYKEGNRIMLKELVTMDEIARAEQKNLTSRPSYTKAFSVQILASRDGNIPISVIREMYEIDIEVFKEFNEVEKNYQYSVGNFDTYTDAAKLRNKLKARGLRGAFVVGYKDGIRVKDIRLILD